MYLVTGIQNEKGYLIKVHVPGHRYPESKGLFDKSRGQNQADFLKLAKQYLTNKCGNVKTQGMLVSEFRITLARK